MPACSCYTERTAGFPLWLCRLTLLPATRDGPPSRHRPSVLRSVSSALTGVQVSHHGFHLPSLGATDGHFLCVFLTSVYFSINSLFMSFAHFQIEFHLVCFLKFLNDLRKIRIYCPPPPCTHWATPVCTSARDLPNPWCTWTPLPPTEPPAGAISFPY